MYKAAGMLILTLAWVVITTPAAFVHGASVVGLSDKLSDQATNVFANHEIAFTVGSGIAASETVTITFPSGFDVSNIDAGDVDVAVDAVDFVDSVDYTYAYASQVITLAFGVPVSAGQTISIEIGANADLGDDQIRNPLLPGSYSIDIGGTAGETGQLGVAIVDATTVTITAIVLGPPTADDSDEPRSGLCVRPVCLFDDATPGIEIQGIAHPRGTVDVFLDGEPITTTPVNDNARFVTIIDNLPTGVYEIALWAADENGRRAAPVVFQVPTRIDTLTIARDIYIAPTLFRETIGGEVFVSGVTAPDASVLVYDNHTNEQNVLPDDFGRFTVPSADIVLGQTLVRSTGTVGALGSFESTDVVPFPMPRSLAIARTCQLGDINNDGQVNLTDMSIAGYWQDKRLDATVRRRENECLNNDDTIDFADYSVIASAWTALIK